MADGTATTTGAATAAVTSSIRRGVELGSGVHLDILDVFAPTVLDALSATRHIWELAPVRILDAPKGAGKTFALARMARRRAVCVSDRKALAAQTAARFGAELRREPGSGASGIRHQALNAERYAVTVHTVPRLRDRRMADDTLVIDEAIHVVRTLATGRELAGPRRPEIHEAFLSMIRRAGEVWFAQAGWTEDDVHTLARLIQIAGRGETILLVVVHTPERRGVATEVPTKEQLRDEAIASAVEGPVVYASTSRTSGEVVRQHALRLGLDPLIVSGRTLHSARVQRWLHRPEPEVEPFVILSPALASGLSIDRRNDGSPAYPRVFMELLCWPGGPSLDDALQMVARVRGSPGLTWHASCSPLPGRSAESHLTQGQAAALASARLVGLPARAANGLDELGSRCLAADEASLAPTPRDAFAAGLHQDGWSVVPCESSVPSPEEKTRWRAARAAAIGAYIADLSSGERGPVDQQTVDARLIELGRPPDSGALSGDALAGVEWLERHHPRRDPMGLLTAMLEPQVALNADRREIEAGLARTDLHHESARVELARTLLMAANLDFDRLARGGLVHVRSTDLSAFVSAAWRYANALDKFFGIAAPRGKGGAVRALSSLLSRAGAEAAGSHRPRGAARVRVYGFRLAPVALDCLLRRFEGAIPAPGGVAGQVFMRTAEDVLSSRVPIRLAADAAASIDAVRERAANADDSQERERLLRVLQIVTEADTPPGAPGTVGGLPPRGLILAKRHRREDSGRIHLLDGPVQNVPKSLRGVLVPEVPGDVFVSADYRSCHVAIAATRTGDAALHRLLDAEDAYALLAAQLLPGVEGGRGTMKKVILAILNGAGPRKIGEVVGSDLAGAHIQETLLASFPGLRNLIAEAKRLHALLGPIAEVPTLTGAIRRIWKNERSSWRKLLSAMWAGPESEALDHVLANLPCGARLVAPMHDGLLVCCDRQEAARVASALRAAMMEGALAAGFSAGVKVGIGDTWAAAEGTAT